MDTNQQTEDLQSKKVFTCVDCETPYDTRNLFVLPLRELSKIKGEDDGPENAFIKPEDLPDFAHCANCRESGETYTLASAIIRSQKDNQLRSMSRLQVITTKAEVEELVSCFSCQESGKETLVARREARAPGWVGCNIVKGRRLKDANPQNPNQNPLPYVTSEDLLKPGKEGFVLCPKCMELAIPVLRNKARELGVAEDIIFKKIRPQSLVAMLEGVRRVGR